MEKLKILIVEDDKSTQTIYNHALNEQIFDKLFASTGNDALSVYQEWRPDIIILDIGLPDVDGVFVLNKIRKESKDISTTIIVASSLSDRERVVECVKIGIQGFVVKPIHSQTISEQILQYYNKANKLKNESDHNDPDIIVELSKHKWSNLEYTEVSTIKVEINVGIEIVIEIKGVIARLHSFVTGIHHGQYIMVQCPKMTGIDTKLFEGNSVRITYLYSGNIYMFNSNILNFIRSPSRLIFLSYPASVEVQQLRKEQRVNCFLKGLLKVVNHMVEYNGMVIDICVGGC